MYLGLDRSTYIFQIRNEEGPCQEDASKPITSMHFYFLTSKIVGSKYILYWKRACNLLWKSSGAIYIRKSDAVLPSVSKPMQSSNMSKNLHEKLWFSSPLAVQVKWWVELRVYVDLVSCVNTVSALYRALPWNSVFLMKKRGTRLQIRLNDWQGLKWEIGGLMVLPCWKIPIWAPRMVQLVCMLQQLTCAIGSSLCGYRPSLETEI